MITSSTNPHVQLIRSLQSLRKERDEQHLWVAEGVRLVEEAIVEKWQIEFLAYTNELSARGKSLIELAKKSLIQSEELSLPLMKSLSDTETSQGLLAIVRQKTLPMPEHLDFVLICDEIRDPGNLGTLLRTASAAGTQSVILTPGTTDPFAPKVLRSAMGAHFRLPIHQMTWQEIDLLCHSRGRNISILLSDAEKGESCYETNLRKPVAIAVGSEAEGVSAEAKKYANGWIKIPMPGKSESLNAAIAASILLFEVVRQRQS